MFLGPMCPGWRKDATILSKVDAKSVMDIHVLDHDITNLKVLCFSWFRQPYSHIFQVPLFYCSEDRI